MTILIYSLLTILAIYAFLVIRCAVVFHRADAVSVPSADAGLPATDVIVAAKNEERNVAPFLQSMTNQTHRNARLIFVDDHSTDSTFNKVKEKLRPPHTIISSNGHGKKEALRTGIEQSDARYILSTDADCFPGPEWASLMVGAGHQQAADMMMAPVIIEPSASNTLIERLQMIESFAFITITAGTCLDQNPVMCNGGNIGYNAAFLKQNTQGMNARYASGDDMFMMEAASKQRRSFAYVKNREAAISTDAVPTLGRLFNQRSRWVSKTGGYTSAYILFFAFMILFGNLAVIASLGLLIAQLMPWWAFASVLGTKLLSDVLSVYVSANYYGRKLRFMEVLMLEICYPAYVVVSILTFWIKGFKWK